MTVWDTDKAMPELGDYPDLVHPEALPLGFTPRNTPELTWSEDVVRVYTEFDTHFLRVTYRGVKLVLELSYDSSPYVQLQHDAPCKPIGLNEALRGGEYRCEQTGGLESLKYQVRNFSAWEGQEEPVFWAPRLSTDECYEGFGLAILGAPVAPAEAFKAGKEFAFAVREVMLDRRAPWWPTWQKTADARYQDEE